MACTGIKLKSRRVCIGNLKHRVIIYERSLATNNSASIESIENFQTTATVWAALETTRGSQLWDGVEVSNPFTHKFYIRYRANIDFSKWLEYENQKYKIVDVENFEQEDDWLLLMCILKGDADKPANYS